MAIVLAAGGVIAVVTGLLARSGPPAPSAGAAGRLTPATPGVVTRRHKASPAFSRSRPLRITIPAIGVDSQLLSVGLNPDGTLAAPVPGSNYDKAAWYRYSPSPGQNGPAVIEGHVDSATDGPSVFYRLGDLRPGNRISVQRADGLVVVFSVLGVRRYSKTEFPTRAVYGDTRYPALRLVTCGGSFDSATGHYRDNTIVFAALRSIRRLVSITSRGASTAMRLAPPHAHRPSSPRRIVHAS